MDFQELADRFGEVIELVGVGVIALGIAVALATYARSWLPAWRDEHRFTRVRQSIGRTILLGLEILVAGDIIRTVAIDPDFTAVGVLAAIVLIRTFLSFTLELEITGAWPWKQRSSVQADV